MSFMGHLKLLRWYEVVPALAKARDGGLLLNVHIYSSAISKLGKARQLKLALQLCVCLLTWQWLASVPTTSPTAP